MGLHLPKMNVRSASGQYPVYFFENFQKIFEVLLGDKLSNKAGASIAPLTPLSPNLFFVVDQKVLEFHPTLEFVLDSYPVLPLKASELEKSFWGVEKVCEFLTIQKANRKSKVVSIGGGVIQEITAFSANIFQRGISWSCVPTTLLAMADSCIGGKNSLNFHNFKNQLGTIYSPAEVFVIPEFLKSLPPLEILSGLGEVVKSSLLLPQPFSFFDELEATLQNNSGMTEADHLLKTIGLPRLAQWIEKSLIVKKTIVEQDEQEKDLRRLLNYGHTFGHALESLCEYKIPHGVCVAWGIDISNKISVQLGLLHQTTYDRIHKVLKIFLTRFQTELAQYDRSPELFEKISRDKKSEGHRIHFICLDQSLTTLQKKISLDELSKLKSQI